jgi:hypothetical protein
VFGMQRLSLRSLTTIPGHGITGEVVPEISALYC